MGLKEIKQLDASTAVAPAQPDDATAPLQDEAPLREVMEITHDSEDNTISFDIRVAVMSEGQKNYEVLTRRVTMREPFPRDFFLMESWMRKAEGDYQDMQIALIKLASLCITNYGDRPGVRFDELFNTLYDLDSSKRLVKALDFFPGRITGYVEHIKQAARTAGIQLPE